MSLFVMTVKDTFHLEGGRTAFVGSIETEAKNIPSCECEIVLGNEVKASIWIDGEDFLKGKQSPDRAISTSQQINLAACGVRRGGFKIRSKA